jgi:hypothetical protein
MHGNMNMDVVPNIDNELPNHLIYILLTKGWTIWFLMGGGGGGESQKNIGQAIWTLKKYRARINGRKKI